MSDDPVNRWAMEAAEDRCETCGMNHHTLECPDLIGTYRVYVLLGITRVAREDHGTWAEAYDAAMEFHDLVYPGSEVTVYFLPEGARRQLLMTLRS